MSPSRLLPAKAGWDNRWEIISDASGEKYTVGQRSFGTWSCSCKKWIFSKAPKPDCKHILELKTERARTDRTPTPTIDRDIPRDSIRLLYHCFGCDNDVEPEMRRDGAAFCPLCGSFALGGGGSERFRTKPAEYMAELNKPKPEPKPSPFPSKTRRAIRLED
jgi:DNA-directed RNA polymerase subunit RPC12/RpoP